MFDPHQFSMITSLIVAAMLGFAVGVEREFVRKEAGIKTYALVTLGAALFTVISFDPNFPDPSRIISQIVVGIGFIGAGIIIFHQNKIHGLTTAAGLWVMAGVGVAAGMRQYTLAVAGTFIVLFILLALRKLKIEDRIHAFVGIKEEEEK